MSTSLRKLKDDFTTAINGYPAASGQPRWKLCAKWADDYFGLVTSSLFVKVNSKKFEKIQKVNHQIIEQ